jgi:hypothetical protein
VGLIVSFLSFAFAIIDPKDKASNARHMFNVGMFFSFIATGCHFGLIVVAGRATALCFRIATTPTSQIDIEGLAAPEDEIHAEFREALRKVDFTRYVTYCERLLLLGTFFLIVSMLFMAFLVFSQLGYAVALVVLSLGGGWSVYRTGFWSVSILGENVMRFVFKWRRRHEGRNTTNQFPHTLGRGTASQGQ